MKGLLGRKLGMTRVFDGEGRAIPVTVVEAGPCTILQARTQERNGYSAIQIGYGARKAKNVSKAVRGACREASREENPPSFIKEIRLEQDPALDSVGKELTVDIFAEKEFVDVTGTTKGSGFQGVVKRHHFAGGRETHGGAWTRRPGSIGCRNKPGKIFKGKPMAGHMGNVRCTVQNLEIVRVIKDENLLLIRGAIPGPNGRSVVIREAKKKGSVKA